MKIAAWMLLVATANAAYLDFGGVTTTHPATLADGTIISEIGTRPDGVVIEAPQPNELVVSVPITDEFFGVTFVSESDSEFVEVVNSDFGFRLDFVGEVDVLMSPYTRTDNQLLSFTSDGTWEVLANHDDFVGDGTSELTTLRGLRHEDTNSLIPIYHGLQLAGATWLEWVPTDWVAHPNNALAAGVGHVSLVSEPSSWVLVIGLVVLVIMPFMPSKWPKLRTRGLHS